MKRYNAVVGGVYDPSVMVEENDGDWVWYEDVEAQCAELLEAAENLVLQIQEMNYGIKSPAQYETSAFVAARIAIAKAKGENSHEN